MARLSEVMDKVEAVARAEGIEPAALKTVVEVESGGNAFATVDGKDMPLILYEYHVFYRYPGLTAAERAEAVRRKLAAPKWGDLPYARSQQARYNQLKRAAEINEQAAHAACSWGVGQVLGENADWLGYGTPKALAERAMAGIEGQIEVMLSFIRKRGLLDELAARDWRGFARAYNGPGQVDHYAKLMKRAYRKHSGQDAPAPGDLDPVSIRLGMKGEHVAELQRRLRGQGYHLIVDGDFGPGTRRAVEEFQSAQGLVADGIAGPRTLARLEVLAGRAVPA